MIKECRDLAVHPRVCGERALRHPRTLICDGSSPRVRGTRTPAHRHHPRPRFIPACAGNAEISATRTPGKSVHPRVCGERPLGWNMSPSEAGSSPRVRGTLGAVCAGRCVHRFIPACAGNAKTTWRCLGCSTVHPRVCGERATRKGATKRYTGSSPRVRGTHDYLDLRPSIWRFIPACAGNARCEHLLIHKIAVHPRVCGERILEQHRQSADLRFIPACAGNARAIRAVRPRMPVHPRVCGERVCSG